MNRNPPLSSANGEQDRARTPAAVTSDNISDEIRESVNGGDGGGYSSFSPSDPNELLLRQGPRHAPLTPLRIVRGLACLLVLLSTAFFMLIFLAPFCCVLVRIFSRHHSRELVAFFFGHWLAMWPFLFENINETRVVFSGDRVPGGERAIVICNHRTEVDWMYIWNLALRKGRIGHVKYVVKNSVRDLPVFGWALYVMEFLLIERKWEVDEPLMERYLSSFKDARDPLWLILFPEGTDYTEQKKLAGQELAEKKGLRKLNHVLMPKTKGFQSCMKNLGSSLDAVYDLTIGYKNRCPLFIDNLFGIDPSEVHIHIRRIPVEQIPSDGNGCSSWLYKAYERKDELLSSFIKKGYFSPGGSIEDKLPTSKSLANFTGVAAFTLVLGYLVASFLWMKLYIGLSCLYFAIVSHFGWRPA
ncbi:hypothetical protein SELMODRAFT_437414 [Selaginella moellendorffii]|uniref:1-acylglycerol-3-phosphate O-acyltransferase n=1 Tax=Selaginella moellendorffii TaxID=88036 RepID=D8QQR3_SELML|nr:probable 1-acyl-sn-glycerol-3-phosphate acyltransferase 5 [Selaginella moellendorffii]EFJ37844.1 hypothetical protein SELMODRAFT_437414 [Selaginella moellendorffii]|eukprot:XP_002960305.1 probable 1-acyl-sn-glycerol-3-phosphate acyltransferase 5 [Selaginella moellendorffii]